MKEFNLERALTGSKIIDEKGDIGEYKMTNIYRGTKTHIFQFSVNDNKDQAITSYKEGIGWYYGFGKNADRCHENIKMAPVKRQEWFNVYSHVNSITQPYSLGGGAYPTENAAREAATEIDRPNYVKSVLIREWEE